MRNLSVWYDRTEVLRDVSFAVPEHGIVALLGGNGSGKSTILNALSGLVKPRGGSVLVAGKEAIGAPSDQMVRLGVVQVPQGREVFASMTVRDNLELGAATLKGRGVTQTVLGEVFELFPALREASSRRAGSLSGGQQQQLALGRALMSRPRVLLMDEPSAGLAPNIVHALIQTIALLNRNGLTILLVEQNVGVAAAVAQTAHVLQNGAIAYTGPASQLINNAEVLASYLGRSMNRRLPEGLVGRPHECRRRGTTNCGPRPDGCCACSASSPFTNFAPLLRRLSEVGVPQRERCRAWR